jgi:hypothetical protein
MKTNPTNQPDGPSPKLIILRGTPHTSPAANDINALLWWIIKRLSLKPKEHCVFEYLFEGDKRLVPKQKATRRTFLEPHTAALQRRLEPLFASRRAARRDPSGLICVGALACECLTGHSYLKERTGAAWLPLPRFQMLGMTKVWVMDDPLSALYNPELAVGISQVIWQAALELGHECKMDYLAKGFSNDTWLRYVEDRNRKRLLGEFVNS